MDKQTETARILGAVWKDLAHYIKKSAGHGDLTHSQAMLMGYLHHNGTARISDISDALGLSDSTVSGIVDRLEGKGAVKRVRDDTDRRVVHVRISEVFQKKHRDFEASLEKIFLKILQYAGPGDMENIRKGLQSLGEAIDSASEKGDKTHDQTF